MKVIYFLVLCLISGISIAKPANDNQFAYMPHDKILELNNSICDTETNALGEPELKEDCIEMQKKAFQKMVDIYNNYYLPQISWSLCIGEAKYKYSYDYFTMYQCMKAVKSICPFNEAGVLNNQNQCMSSMKSGLWVNHPNTKKSFNEVFKQ